MFNEAQRWFEFIRCILCLGIIISISLCGCSWGTEDKSSNIDTESVKSPFAIRGALPWHNFLSGPSAWNVEEYEHYLDSLEELGFNFICFHCYTGGVKEKFALYVEPIIRIEYNGIVPQASFDTSLTARWGYRPLAVKDFAFGTSKLFQLPEGAKAFGADCAVLARTKEEHYRFAKKLMQRVLQMAHERSIQMGIGFEFGIQPPEILAAMPIQSKLCGGKLTDPTHPASIEILRAKLNDIFNSYPDIDWIILWLHEHPTRVPKTKMSTEFRIAREQQSHLFEEADNEMATFIGVWSLEYIRRAYAYINERAPQVKIAIAGWGGSSKLPTILRGLDRGLPKDIVFMRLNPYYGFKPQPPVLAEIAKNRKVWAVPWLESDSQLWHLQPRIALMKEHIQLAHKQGLNGVIALHWRTEETRLNLEAFAKFVHEPNKAPSVEAIYREACKRRYGQKAALVLAPVLAQMDNQLWLEPEIISPEYGSYSPIWGRLKPKTREQFVGIITRIKQLAADTIDPRHKANLNWLAANFEFMILLDEVGRKIEPAYNLKNKGICKQTDSNILPSEIKQARKALNEAPIEELFHTYARRVRSRGELGVLSSLNQKLWLCHKELDNFFATLQNTDVDSSSEQ